MMNMKKMIRLIFCIATVLLINSEAVPVKDVLQGLPNTQLPKMPGLLGNGFMGNGFPGFPGGGFPGGFPGSGFPGSGFPGMGFNPGSFLGDLGKNGFPGFPGGRFPGFPGDGFSGFQNPLGFDHFNLMKGPIKL